MNITSQHITGFVVGVGEPLLVLFYKKNQAQVDDFLRRQGIQIPERTLREPANMIIVYVSVQSVYWRY